MKVFFKSILGIFIFLYSGCGTHNTSTSTYTGYLIDAAVQGVEYSCGEQKGITGEHGEFSCVRLPVSFRIGTLTLGTLNQLPNDNKIFPHDLLGISRTDKNNDTVIKMAQLLQGLDTDGDLTNGIQINTTAVVNINTTQTLQNLDIVKLAQNIGIQLPSKEDAIKHLNEEVAQALPAGFDNTTPKDKPNTPTNNANQSGTKPSGGLVTTTSYKAFTRPLKLQIKTDNIGVTNNTSFLISTQGSGYNYNVDCDSDGSLEAQNIHKDYICKYSTAGSYTISIYGTFPQISFNSDGRKDISKVISVLQWGNGEFRSMHSAFDGCYNLTTIQANDVPNLNRVKDMSYMFANSSVNGDFNSWDTSNVTNMQGLFQYAANFNFSLTGWDVSHVTDMSHMFDNASNFNGDISNWNVGQVRKMNNMFSYTPFNKDISNWNMSAVMDVSNMFNYADKFNQNLNSWNLSKVTNMAGMFYNAFAFNGNISSWDVSQVIDMSNMFNGAIKFNGDLSQWNVSKVITMKDMFNSASVFNGNITTWNPSSVTTMANMFYNAKQFNQDLSSWTVGSVMDMSNMFNRAISFNQNLALWNISNVKNMTGMFINVTLSTNNYDALLQSWGNQQVRNRVVFDAGNSRYTIAQSQTARDTLVQNANWTINDGGGI